MKLIRTRKVGKWLTAQSITIGNYNNIIEWSNADNKNKKKKVPSV